MGIQVGDSIGCFKCATVWQSYWLLRRYARVTGLEGSTTFDWTSQGELAQVTTPSATVGYEYDLDRNVTTRIEGGASVEYVYDSLTGLPRAVWASDGSWWVYVDGVPLAQHTSIGTTAYLHTDV